MRRVRLNRAGILQPMNPLGSAWAPSVPRWVDTSYVPPAPVPAPAPAPVYVAPAPVPYAAPTPIAAPVAVEPPNAPPPVPYYAPQPVAPPPPAPAPAGPFCECVGDPTAPGFAPGQAEQITFDVESVNTSDGGGNGEIQTSAAPGTESGKSGLPLMLLIAAVLFGS